MTAEAHPCGHAERTAGCGGCDPGAIDFVIDDDGTVTFCVTHDCPRDGEAVTLCCGRRPFELPRDDRMTLHPELVTCQKETDR